MHLVSSSSGSIFRRLTAVLALIVAGCRAGESGSTPSRATAPPTTVTTSILPGPEDGKEAFEPSIAIDPTNPDRIVAAAMYGNPSARGGTGIWTWETRDGGRTWSSTRMRPPLIGTKPAGWAADVIAGLTPDGAAVLTSMAGARDPRSDGLGGIVVTRRSITDTAWSDPVMMAHDRPVPGGERAISYDKPWMAIDRHDGSRYRGSVYVIVGALDLVLPAHAWAENPTDMSRLVLLGLDFAVSRDGGASFGPVRRVADSVFGGDMTVAPNGDVEVVFPRSSGGTSAIVHLRSTDGGASFESPVEVAAAGDGLALATPVIAARPDGTLMACWAEQATGTRLRCARRPVGGGWQTAAAIGVAIPEDRTFAFPTLAATATGWYLSVYQIGPAATDVVLYRSDGGDFRPLATLTTIPGLGLGQWCFTRECRGFREDLFVPGDYASLAAGGGRVAAGYVLPRPGGSLVGRAAVYLSVIAEPE